MAWQVKVTEEYAAWFSELIKDDLGSATLVAQAVAALRELLQSEMRRLLYANLIGTRRRGHEGAIEIQENGNVVAIANARGNFVPILEEMWNLALPGPHPACATSVRSCMSMRISVRSERTLAAQR